ncbi:unnamed protein product, partial [Iphiclides podalirius]
MVQSKRLDPGPQTFAEKTPTDQNHQKRATDEVIVYLTPSQIKALQEGRGYLNAEPVDQAETSQENQEEPEQTQQEEEGEEEGGFQLGSLELNSQLEQDENQVPSSIPVEEPSSEEIEEGPQFPWIYRPPQDRKFVPSPEDNYAYLRYFPETETQTEAAQIESEENEEESEEAQPEIQQQQRFRLVPYEAATEKSEPSTTKAPQDEQIRERWLRLLEQNRSLLRKAQEKTTTTTTTTEQPQAEPGTTLSRLRFSARYNDQKQAIENEDQRRKNILDKQKALIRAEARANNAPVVVRKEVTITKQAPLIKHIKVHTPVLVPIPEPFEVKVPHPFPVPLDIFRPLSSQAKKAKKAEAKKSAAAARAEEEKPKVSPKKPAQSAEKAAAERRAPADSKKEVTVEAPSRQRGQPERITIIRHSWDK